MSPLRIKVEARRGALIMGVLNRTPDSFSDGGRYSSEPAACARIEALIAEGADIVDIGAESTRPGAPAVPDAEQIARVGGSVEFAARLGAVVSIDTTSPAVADWALKEGASVVNSVSLDAAAALGAVCAQRGAALILMHSRGPMASMSGFSAYPDNAYADVVADVAREWFAAAGAAIDAGLPRGELLLDPGLGFMKNARQSVELCARLDELCSLGFPVVVGPSRKSFLSRAAAAADDRLPEAPPEGRLGGTIAAALACVARGAAAVRVHDVAAVRQALAVARALDSARSLEAPRAHPASSLATGVHSDG